MLVMHLHVLRATEKPRAKFSKLQAEVTESHPQTFPVLMMQKFRLFRVYVSQVEGVRGLRSAVVRFRYSFLYYSRFGGGAEVLGPLGSMIDAA